jgi:hypothetical protein
VKYRLQVLQKHEVDTQFLVEDHFFGRTYSKMERGTGECLTRVARLHYFVEEVLVSLVTKLGMLKYKIINS